MLQRLQLGAELALFFEQLGEPEPGLSSLGLDLGEPERELTLAGHLFGSASPLAVAIPDVLQSLTGAALEPFAVLSELLALYIFYAAPHPGVREEVGASPRGLAALAALAGLSGLPVIGHGCCPCS